MAYTWNFMVVWAKKSLWYYIIILEKGSANYGPKVKSGPPPVGYGLWAKDQFSFLNRWKEIVKMIIFCDVGKSHEIPILAFMTKFTRT